MTLPFRNRCRDRIRDRCRDHCRANLPRCQQPRLPRIAVGGVGLALAALIVSAGCSPSEGEAGDEQPPVAHTLSIEAADERREFQIEVARRSSVLDLLKAAEEQGKLEFEFVGSGGSAFVTAIDGLANARDDATRYWVFYVNGQMAQRGCGVVRLEPGDRVRWVYQASPY